MNAAEMHNRLSAGRCWLWCCCLLLAACGHIPETHNPRREQAAELNLQARDAYRHGEYRSALRLYQSSLGLDQSIENADGIAINLVSLARVCQVLGRDAEAGRYLDRVLQERALKFAPQYMASAAAEKAVLKLREGNAADAAHWVEQAQRYCGSACDVAGNLANLRANIALNSGQPERAVYWGERAISANQGRESSAYANALRLTAQARMLKGEFDVAARLLGNALAVDKSLGLPPKIRLDLSLLARAYGEMGKQDLSRQYAERAGKIFEGSGMPDQTGEMP